MMMQCWLQAKPESISKGLVELQKALWDPHSVRRDETLAACFGVVIVRGYRVCI